MLFNHLRFFVGERLPALCCSTPPPQWFSALNNRLRGKNVYQAKFRNEQNTELGKSPWLAKASECMSCSGAQKKKRGKRATRKRKDKTNVEREVRIPPTHKQINFNVLFMACAVRDGYTSSRKEKTFNVPLDSKLQHCPRVKIKGSSWGARSVYMLNSTRGVWDFIFSDFRGQILIQGTVTLNWD